MLIPIIQNQIEQQTAVLSPGEGNINMIKLLKEKMYSC